MSDRGEITLTVWHATVTPPAVTAGLSELLRTCVEGGASVSFLAPLEPAVADRYWAGVAEAVAEGRTALIVAGTRDRRVVGTAQLCFSPYPNQPHRADVAKVMVDPGLRRVGLGRRLMDHVEAVAADHRRTLLVLDTVPGSDAERLYRRLGWQLAGEIPDFALTPDGVLAPTAVYWKRIPTG